MKNLVLASIIAITAALPFGTSAQATGATISNVQYVYPGWRHRYYGSRYYGPYRYHRNCHFETVRHHRYGRWWVERVRVCR